MSLTLRFDINTNTTYMMRKCCRKTIIAIYMQFCCYNIISTNLGNTSVTQIISGFLNNNLLLSSSNLLSKESALVYQQVREHIDESACLNLLSKQFWPHGLP